MTITVTAPLVINNIANSDELGDIVIDGGGIVTLGGGGTTRIIHARRVHAAVQQPALRHRSRTRT